MELLRKWDCNVPTLRFSNKTIWEKKRIKDFCEVNPKTEELEDEFIYIDLESVSKGCLLSKNIISKTNAPSRAQRVLTNNDILFQCVRPYQMNNLLFNAENADFQYVASTGYAQIRTQENPSFVYHLLHSPNFNKEVMLRCTGSSYPAITSSDLGDIEVYICGVGEQQKIGHFLDLIDRRIAVQNKIISKYETLIKGIYHEFFSKPADYAIKIKDLIIKGKAGGTPSSTVARYYNGDIPFLSISDMTKQGKYVSHTEKHINESGIEDSSAWIVPSNSLIFSMYASVGLVCINTVPLATSQAMFSMVLKDCRMIEYIYYYLNFFRDTKIHRHIETGTQSNINAETVRNIEIPFQSNHSKLVETINSIEKRLNNEKDMLSLLVDLKAYLLSKLFI